MTPLRLLVTGKQGQVVSALLERAPSDIEVVALGRPELDLAEPDTVARALADQYADVVVNAAAYTAVDRAESEEDLATRINGESAGRVAEAARALGAPILQLSTDYVFDGALDRPYREDDATGPIGAYGRSKLAGEIAAAEANPRCAILRTAWVYSPFGANFVKTMLRLGETRAQMRVVADQIGSPTSALDLADAIFEIARQIVASPGPRKYGVFHMTSAGEASWAEFAAAIFAEAERHGRPPVAVVPIRTEDYPTPARRPANSRLDSARLAGDYGVTFPSWRDSLKPVVARLLDRAAT
jgi:dTDP-4-dehydrorhamnose reductase